MVGFFCFRLIILAFTRKSLRDLKRLTARDVACTNTRSAVGAAGEGYPCPDWGIGRYSVLTKGGEGGNTLS